MPITATQQQPTANDLIQAARLLATADLDVLADQPHFTEDEAVDELVAVWQRLGSFFIERDVDPS